VVMIGKMRLALASAVSAANSLTDITVASQYGPIAVSAIALSNGNYLIDSQVYGTVTWGDGRTGIVGVPSASNSLIGPGWGCGDHTTTAFSDGNYAVKNPCFSMGILGGIGAVTLGRGTGGTVGPIVAANSVLGTVSNGGTAMVFDYDAGHATLIVGQPFANMISLFSYDPVFANGFE